MLKLIHADFYKVFRRPMFYILLIVLPLLAAALVLIAIRGRRAGTITGAFYVSPQLLPYPAALLPLITELTLGEELRGHEVKNTIEYGTSRVAYFLAKLISTILLGALFVLLVYGVYFGTAVLSMPLGKGVTPELAQFAFSRIGAAFAVYVAASAMSMFWLTVFNRSLLAIFVYYGGFYLTGLFMRAFSLTEAQKYILETQLSALSGENPPDFGLILAVAAVTFVVFCIGGLIVLRKKDLV